MPTSAVLQTPSAQLNGTRTARNISGTCDSISCPLGSAVTQQRTFFDACERYAGNVSGPSLLR
jgi:hypothetical protein